MIFYEGPSMITGKPIVAIATGLTRRTTNAKTGDMVQTWILCSDMNPTVAINTGDDESICGSCPMRGIIEEGRNRWRSCYVAVRQAPWQIYEAYQNGSYDREQPNLTGRSIRLGAYGDPCAVPYSYWKKMIDQADGHTGYTHSWRTGKFWRFRRIVMASVESRDDAALAQSKGWRTFRSSKEVDPKRGEFLCPASEEAGKRLTCFECRACNGSGNNHRRASVVNPIHGGPGVLSSYQHAFGEQQ